MTADQLTYTDLPLVDRDGNEIGRVTDVISDPRTLERILLVVKTGMIKGEHPVPIAIVEHEGDRLVATVDEDLVNSAPKVTDHATMGDQELSEILSHYGAS